MYTDKISITLCFSFAYISFSFVILATYKSILLYHSNVLKFRIYFNANIKIFKLKANQP